MGRVHTTVLGDARDPVPALDHEPDQAAATPADTDTDPEAPAPRTKKRSTT